MNRTKVISFAKTVIFAVFIIFNLTGCYSVFSGGTGGRIVDAESTSTPKAGIANVDIYAYTKEADRDADFNNWIEGTTFIPNATYYGHTTSGNDGGFSLGKLVWKAYNPDFGKDADYTDVYLLFYHKNYGLTKGQTVVLSDSVTDTVYVELVSVRKSTALNLSFIDVATGAATNVPVFVKVKVSQATAANPRARSKSFNAVITGNGTLIVDYPRWYSPSKQTSGIENTPEVTITYVQSADEITWMGCYNADNDDKDYSFRDDCETGIKKTIQNSVYNMNFYGKSTKIRVPSIYGQYISSGDSKDDGVSISLKQKDETDAYSIDLGQVTTYVQAVGNTGTEKHGTFSGLGSAAFWTDYEYKGKYSEIDVEVSGGSKKKQLTLRNDSSSYYVQLQ